MASASILYDSGHGLGEMPPPLSRPLGPPPGILYPSMPAPYRQGIFPTLTYSTVGPTMGYNFDPMMGQPLWPSISCSYPFLPQLPGILFPTSISPNLAGLLASLDLGEEKCPLVVESPSHSSQVVAGGMIPTIMVSSSAVEAILSASPRLTPRVSTSSANVTGGDVCKVIQQHPLSSPNIALIGAGVGRGQVLARKLGPVCPFIQSNKTRRVWGTCKCQYQCELPSTHCHEAGLPRSSSLLL